jgi:uncharacterized protein
MHLIILSACAVLFGLGIDSFYRFVGISPQAIIGEASELIPETVKLIAVVLLLGFSINPLYKLLRKKIAKPKVQQTVFFSQFPPAGAPLIKTKKSK